MERVVITTKTCPCCKYQYQTVEHYKVVQKQVTKRVPRIKNGKPVEITPWEKMEINQYPYGELARKKTKVVKVLEPQEELSKSGIPRGRKDFIPIKVVVGCDIEVIGMEGPNCGIYMNAGKCTTKEEKQL